MLSVLFCLSTVVLLVINRSHDNVRVTWREITASSARPFYSESIPSQLKQAHNPRGKPLRPRASACIPSRGSCTTRMVAVQCENRSIASFKLENENEGPSNYSVPIEEHWERVAEEIAKRGSGNLIAGDDTPFTRYYREQFLEDFRETIKSFGGLDVLELGCGPGGNLVELASLGRPPLSITGCDISSTMLAIAGSNLGCRARLVKTDGKSLPFPDDAFDVAYTVTVLQHVTDDADFVSVVSELARVTRHRLILYEEAFPYHRRSIRTLPVPLVNIAAIFADLGSNWILSENQDGFQPYCLRGLAEHDVSGRA